MRRADLIQTLHRTVGRQPQAPPGRPGRFDEGCVRACAFESVAIRGELLVTSADLPLVHHFFLPAGDVQSRPYSSSLLFRAGGESFLIGALPKPTSPRPTGDTELERLARAAATGQLRFELAAAPVMGRFRPVATLEVGERLPDELDALRSDPWNCGGGLSPVGTLNRMRESAYRLSQAAWGRTRSAASQRQEEADRLVGQLFG